MTQDVFGGDREGEHLNATRGKNRFKEDKGGVRERKPRQGETPAKGRSNILGAGATQG